MRQALTLIMPTNSYAFQLCNLLSFQHSDALKLSTYNTSFNIERYIKVARDELINSPSLSWLPHWKCSSFGATTISSTSYSFMYHFATSFAIFGCPRIPLDSSTFCALTLIICALLIPLKITFQPCLTWSLYISIPYIILVFFYQHLLHFLGQSCLNFIYLNLPTCVVM